MGILENTERLALIRTRRSLVPPPDDRDDPMWEESWRFLFHQYTPAMQQYVRRILTTATGGSVSLEEASDVVQEYLTCCLEKGWLSRDAAVIRCFRAYLQTQLRRHVYDYLEHKHRKKRRPPGLESAEVLESIPGDAPDPAEAEFDSSIVRIVVDRCLEKIRGRNETYARILDDLLATDGVGSVDLAERMKRTPREIAYLKHRARRRFGILFVDELAASVRDREALDDLIRALRPYLP